MFQATITNFFIKNNLEISKMNESDKSKFLSKAAFIINNINTIDDCVILLECLNDCPDIFENELSYQRLIENKFKHIIDFIKLEEKYEFFNYLNKLIIADLINCLICNIKDKTLSEADTEFYIKNIYFLLKILIKKISNKETIIRLIKDEHEVFILRFILEYYKDEYIEDIYNKYIYYSKFKSQFLALCKFKTILKLYSIKNIIKRMRK